MTNVSIYAKTVRPTKCFKVKWQQNPFQEILCATKEL